MSSERARIIRYNFFCNKIHVRTLFTNLSVFDFEKKNKTPENSLLNLL
jgi:hypothetical protein